MSELSRSENRPIRRLAPRIMSGLGIVAGCVVMPTYVGDYVADSLHDVIGQETKTESTLESKIAATFNLDVNIHCTPIHGELSIPFTSLDASSSHINGQIVKVFSRPSKNIRLDPAVCDGLQDFMDKPGLTDDALPQSHSRAIDTLAHEVSHELGGQTRGFVGNESSVQCYTFQRVGQVATMLGANEEDTWQISRINAGVIPRVESGEYAELQNCVKTGPLDLHVVGGVFPVQLNSQ